jgi:hypothetical protein
MFIKSYSIFLKVGHVGRNDHMPLLLIFWAKQPYGRTLPLVKLLEKSALGCLGCRQQGPTLSFIDGTVKEGHLISPSLKFQFCQIPAVTIIFTCDRGQPTHT